MKLFESVISRAEPVKIQIIFDGSTFYVYKDGVFGDTKICKLHSFSVAYPSKCFTEEQVIALLESEVIK